MRTGRVRFGGLGGGRREERNTRPSVAQRVDLGGVCIPPAGREVWGSGQRGVSRVSRVQEDRVRGRGRIEAWRHAACCKRAPAAAAAPAPPTAQRTVVAQHAHGLRAVPRGERVCGEARVHQGQEGAEQLVLQVQEVLGHLHKGGKRGAQQGKGVCIQYTTCRWDPPPAYVRVCPAITRS